MTKPNNLSNFKLLTRRGDKWTKEQTKYINKVIHFHSIGNVSKKFVKNSIFGLYNDLEYEDDNLGSCLVKPTKYLLLNFDINIEKNISQDLRGFACLSIKREKTNKTNKTNKINKTKPNKRKTKNNNKMSLHIDFITCQKIGQIAKNIKSRSHISVKTGKEMLFWIKDFVKEYNLKQNGNEKSKITSITLNSTDDVIGFYWKYGWRFKNNTRNKDIWNERIQMLNSYQNCNKINGITKETILKKYFDSYLEGYYKYSNKEDLRMSGYKMCYNLIY